MTRELGASADSTTSKGGNEEDMMWVKEGLPRSLTSSDSLGA